MSYKAHRGHEDELAEYRDRPSKKSRQKRRDKSMSAAELKEEDLGPQKDKIRAMTEPVNPMTDGQRAYDRAFDENKVIFGVGPAGTGKTWFAAMRAARALQQDLITKIYVTRPMVQAEEKMGHLPGTLRDKYDPYIAPVADALEEFFGTGAYEYMVSKEIIQGRPIALMRGATLKNCWVIADEMQNATEAQIKLVLTRIGHNAKMIINGDPTQTDIPKSKSGLIATIEKLKSVNNIESVSFARSEIVREGIIQDIIEALEDNS